MVSNTWTILAFCLAAASATAWLRAHRRGQTAQQIARAALSTEEATLRLLRLSATDQRNVALTLFGHAEAGNGQNGAVAGLARRLLDMSDTLTQQTETPAAIRTLDEEAIALMPTILFARDQVAAHMGPSRRAWRLDPAFEQATIRADRRALNQILVNVLSGAAASTRDGDWIELTCQSTAQTWSLIVQDEGIGLPVSQSASHPEESRGICLRLTLARSLMKAHGGTLTVQSTERVGTRVTLTFPASRLQKV